MRSSLDRRSFLAGSAAATLAMPAFARAQQGGAAGVPRFSTTNTRWQAAYDAALDVLAGNVKVMPYVSKPVLIEGSVYQGIWQECGPHEALLYRKFRPDVARNSHLTFFELQRADGQLPANNKVVETGFGQIQMVVPIAATAWDLARATGDGELLEAAYRACGAWDGWLMRHRNTRGTGLVEGFCTYDTGHDNSPRWKGMPNQCPNKDARTHHPIASLPRLCPDLSATVYGGRRALAAMAEALGKRDEAARWAEQAEAIRRRILDTLYVAEDAAFYDLNAQNQFVRVRSDILSRVCGEHVVDQKTFDTLWARQLGNRQAFWTRYPMASIAMDDPTFVRPIPANSWGGASQALTAMRAPRWIEHYGRTAEFTEMMNAWCEAIQADPSFRQQIDPETGAFTHGEDQPRYSPCALVMVDYSWRLVGVVEEPDALHWNVRPGHPAAVGTQLSLPTDAGRTAAMAYDGRGASLTLSGKLLGRIEGGAVRLITATDGTPRALLGIEPKPQRVTLRLAGRLPRTLTVHPNRRIPLDQG
ncbi:alpha-L-rhamnosidase [Sphingomonas sp. ABOLF]|uniref:MGH1-like glycoside hydrolase domain-containing protein n=1 Tax=Sphingomonas sp. ABOLF TaxID=1985879 RepID=UPI000F7E6A59|nr:alpha-L-rhamnosidase [Sphingomonas sp. ABOLF]RSV17447.1 alpha-L-rhamnosidase [Sphingomonas sp. ABOLF]